MTSPAPPPPRLLFRPDAFFIKPWRGWGVIRDARGRTAKRFETSGGGSVGSRAARTFQTICYDDGTTTTTEWEIETDDEAHFYARDPKTELEGRGRESGEEFIWDARMPVKTRFGTFTAKIKVVYTLLSPTAAFGFTETRMLGVLVSTATTYFEHVPEV